jgi:signal recognition particle subunit SRP54
MASRILGMGDVLTLIEDAQNKLDEKKAEEMAKKLMTNRFDFNDLYDQFDQIKKMGPLKGILSKIPGIGNQLDDADIDDRQIDWLQAIILSMTPEERSNPSVINPSRKRRIAAGSGRTVEEVNRLLKQLDQMQKMIKQMNNKGGSKKRRRKKMLPGLGGMPLDGMGGMGGMPPF